MNWLLTRLLFDMLSEQHLKQIKKEIALINQDSSFLSPGIPGDSVFRVLENIGTLIFYPFDETDLWGIYASKQDRDYFIINSSLPLEKQIFAAAHELAHSFDIARIPFEVVTSDLLMEYSDHDEYGEALQSADIVANRFAAEFLVGKSNLLIEWDSLSSSMDIKSRIVLLSDLFLVPYKTILKRLKEIGILEEGEQYSELSAVKKEEIASIAERLECCSRNFEVPQQKRLGNYANKALTLYEQYLSTYVELEERLSFINETPEQYDVHDDNIDSYELLKHAEESRNG